jgi:hypothetical protein
MRKSNSLIVSIFIIILVGALAYSVVTCGGDGSTATTTTGITTTITTTITTAATVTVSPLDASQEVQSACTYLGSNYNTSVGLIAETPSHTRYFLYSDNFLAALAMPRGCPIPPHSRIPIYENINSTLSKYNSSQIPNQFMVFQCKWYFQGSHDYDLSGDIWTTVNNQTGLPLNASAYADVAFLQAYYDVTCLHNIPAAITVYNTGADMYNGVGFNDTPFQIGQSKGIYQTYKLAFYIYTAILLNQTVPLSALVNMARMQAPNGGFYTGYDDGFSNDNTSTNTETTCLAIMALRALFR